MIKTKNVEVMSQEVHDFLKNLKLSQEKIEEKEFTVYPKVSLYLALKHKIFYADLLTHPVILTRRKFYEEKEQIVDDKLLKNILGKVLEYEMSANDEILNHEQRTKCIKLFSKLKKKFENQEVNI
jgi:hypothetical protein